MNPDLRVRHAISKDRIKDSTASPIDQAGYLPWLNELQTMFYGKRARPKHSVSSRLSARLNAPYPN